MSVRILRTRVTFTCTATLPQPSHYNTHNMEPLPLDFTDAIHSIAVSIIKKKFPRPIRKIVFATAVPLAPQTDRGDNRVAVMLIVHNSTFSQVDHTRYFTCLYFSDLLWSSCRVLNKAHDCICLATATGEQSKHYFFAPLLSLSRTQLHPART